YGVKLNGSSSYIDIPSVVDLLKDNISDKITLEIILSTETLGGNKFVGGITSNESSGRYRFAYRFNNNRFDGMSSVGGTVNFYNYFQGKKYHLAFLTDGENI